MRATKVFKGYEEYQTWTEKFEYCRDYIEVPVAVDTVWTITSNVYTECKSWKTALRRFEKAFRDVYPEIIGWVELMKENCENGRFEDSSGWNVKNEENPPARYYRWSVEETTKGHWNVVLALGREYTNREARECA